MTADPGPAGSSPPRIGPLRPGIRSPPLFTTPQLPLASVAPPPLSSCPFPTINPTIVTKGESSPLVRLRSARILSELGAASSASFPCVLESLVAGLRQLCLLAGDDSEAFEVRLEIEAARGRLEEALTDCKARGEGGPVRAAVEDPGLGPAWQRIAKSRAAQGAGAAAAASAAGEA